MKRFLNSVLCMCIAVFCTHAQKKNVTSVLEVMDITTGQRSVVKEFPFLIEAPNWTPDGNWLVYNSGGKLYKLSPESPGEPQLINSDYATRCNNDHVISADGKQIAISNVGGTSLNVYPAAGLLRYFTGAALAVVNKTPTPADARADLVIQASIGRVLGGFED